MIADIHAGVKSPVRSYSAGRGLWARTRITFTDGADRRSVEADGNSAVCGLETPSAVNFHFQSPSKDSIFYGGVHRHRSMSKTTVNLDDELDRWRWACPRGHRGWEATNNHFWCAECASWADEAVDPEFDELHDRKTGRTVPREELRLLTRAGPYDTLREGSA